MTPIEDGLAAGDFANRYMDGQSAGAALIETLADVSGVNGIAEGLNGTDILGNDLNLTAEQRGEALGSGAVQFGALVVGGGVAVGKGMGWIGEASAAEYAPGALEETPGTAAERLAARDAAFEADNVIPQSAAGPISLPVAPESQGAFNLTAQFENVPPSMWADFPAGVPRPTGPIDLLEGEAYDAARSAANQINRSLSRGFGLNKADYQVHEIVPVKFDGSPTALSNKVGLSKIVHQTEDRRARLGRRGLRPTYRCSNNKTNDTHGTGVP